MTAPTPSPSPTAIAHATPITVAYGDGIGPEIMAATLHILKAGGAQLAIEEIEIGEKQYLAGNTSGMPENAWDSLRRTRVFLKAPITTPQGGGYKSLNVTTRKTLGLYANVRPAVAYAPFIETKHPGMDVVVVRENEEDLYGGVEYKQTDEMTISLKLISRPGSERIVRYAFDYARAHGRKKVTCFTKDNIMKVSDGLFHKIFDEISPLYPDIEAEHWIVDIGAAKLADTPENFDVVVMPNLYGDVLSDVAAQIAGSVGLAGSANIGQDYAMFEAIHGSAPRRAGQNVANPSGLLHGAILMLVHIGQAEAAERVHNAWLKTVEEGIHTYDVFKEGVSTQKVGTKEFGEAVAARVGQRPATLRPADYAGAKAGGRGWTYTRHIKTVKDLVGVDVFVDAPEATPNGLGAQMTQLAGELKCVVVANRGTKVWPDGHPETFCTDHWSVRFQAQESGASITQGQVAALLGRLAAAGIDSVGTASLYNFDGGRGYSLAQGQ